MKYNTTWLIIKLILEKKFTINIFQLLSTYQIVEKGGNSVFFRGKWVNQTGIKIYDIGMLFEV